jgi:hypothetical protein
VDEILLRFSGGFGNSGLLSDTASSTPDFSAYLSEGDESSSSRPSLANVLEPNVPPRFYLSPRAAAGILRRAERRGKALPETLRAALESLASQMSPSPIASRHPQATTDIQGIEATGRAI